MDNRPHPSTSSLELFMRGELEGEESRAITLHLMGGCDSCKGVASTHFPGQPGVSGRSASFREVRGQAKRDYAEVYRKVLPKVWNQQIQLSQEKSEAARLFAELAPHPQSRRLLLVRNSRRFVQWPLCEILLDEGYRLRTKDPARSLELIELGETVSLGLDSERYGAPLVEDLRGRSKALHANALRIRSDLRAASSKLEEAEAHLDHGTQDPLERARFLKIKAHLQGEYREWTAAIRSLDAAIALLRQAGERHTEGVATIDKSVFVGFSGDADGAIELLRVGLQLADREREPRVYVAAKHNLVHLLCESGRFHQAQALVPEVRCLHSQSGNAIDLLRFRWLEAKIAIGHGDFEFADSVLREVRSSFAAQEMIFDAALVSLDLAIVLLRTGQNVELKRVAQQMVGVFAALEIHREAIAALVLFQKAVDVEEATTALALEVADFLGRVRSNPSLQFKP